MKFQQSFMISKQKANILKGKLIIKTLTIDLDSADKNMNTLALLIGIVSIITFLVGTIWLIVQSFKRKFWWGLFTLLLFPFAIFIFPVVNGKLSRRPVLLIGTGFTLLLCTGYIQQGSVPALIFAILIAFVSAYFYNRWKSQPITSQAISLANQPRENKSSFPSRQTTLPLPLPQKSFRFGFSRKLIKTAQGIVFDSNRFDTLLQREQSFFTTLGELPSSKGIAKLFDNDELIASVANFSQRHFASLMKGKVLSKVKWQDEQCHFFIQMMKKKYQLSEMQIIALLVYVYDEQLYADYNNSFDDTITENPEAFMHEVVLRDIYTQCKPNYEYISRLAQDVGINLKRQPVEQLYEVAKEEIKLKQFEKNLTASPQKSYTNIEAQIRSEKQLEEINRHISQQLSIDPNDYIIVGLDHSRSSRIDNYYKEHFSYTLSKAFGGHCCRCQEGMGQLEFDHFWLPKSKGGNFLMRAKTGIYVNNCIPLCRSCNASKNNRDFRDFFTEEELIQMIEISQSINEYINQQMVDFVDPDFINRPF